MLYLFLLINIVRSLKIGYFGDLRKSNINLKKEKYDKIISNKKINNKKMNDLVNFSLKEEKLPDYYIPEWVYQNVFSENKKKKYD